MRTALILVFLLAAGPSAAQSWQSLAESSELTFTAYFEDEPFEGRFGRFEVAVDFDPAQPQDARLDVTVDVTTVDTDNRDRDTALAESEWFDFGRHPEARYEANGFQPEEDGAYRADGQLFLKGIRNPVPIRFQWRRTMEGAELEGRASLIGDGEMDRTDFDIGTGEWTDPSLIGHRVDLRFHVQLRSVPKVIDE